MKTRLSRLLLLALLASIFGCANNKELDDNAQAKEIYEQGKDALVGRDYQHAIELYSQLESRFPFGVYTQQAILDTAYAHYKNSDTDLALSTADRFIKLYPRHPNVDYAYYLRGIANFNRDDNIIERIAPSDKSLRDAEPRTQAYTDFSNLVTKFPASRYVADAKEKMVILQAQLAAHELHIAEYYYKRNAYVAAANRGKFILENYPLTPQREQALAIMAKSYQKLGMTDLASDTQRVLDLNYPKK